MKIGNNNEQLSRAVKNSMGGESSAKAVLQVSRDYFSWEKVDFCNLSKNWFPLHNYKKQGEISWNSPTPEPSQILLTNCSDFQ